MRTDRLSTGMSVITAEPPWRRQLRRTVDRGSGVRLLLRLLGIWLRVGSSSAAPAGLQWLWPRGVCNAVGCGASSDGGIDGNAVGNGASSLAAAIHQDVGCPGMVAASSSVPRWRGGDIGDNDVGCVASSECGIDIGGNAVRLGCGASSAGFEPITVL